MVSTSSARNNRLGVRRPLRSAPICGLLLAGLSLVAGCKQEPAAQASATALADAPTQPAGHVVAIAGAVQARRAAAGAQARPLALQSEVFADDTVHTAAEASVTIALEHNLARWTLGPNQARRVDASLAWKAPREAATAMLARAPVAEGTNAAGRHSEREAAGTAESALRAEPAAEPAADDLPAPSAPAPEAKPSKVARALDAGEALEAPKTARRRPRKTSRGSGSSARPEPRREAAPPSRPKASRDLDDAMRGGLATGSGAMSGAGMSGRPSQMRENRIRMAAYVAIKAGGKAKLDASMLARLAARQRPRARHCAERAARRRPDVRGTVVLKLTLGAKPHVDVVRDDTGASDLVACLRSRTVRLRIPDQPDGAWLELTYKFKPL